ncbi:MAG: hypothetical protein U0L11_10045 [Acutalibacteraceae bacterium]|nr:hypothetical protein [Acutalibacteraceae bacterium]
MEYAVNEYARVIGSLSVSQTSKEKIEEELFRNLSAKKEFPKKYVAAASAAVLLTAGVAVAVKKMKHGEKNNAR